MRPRGDAPVASVHNVLAQHDADGEHEATGRRRDDMASERPAAISIDVGRYSVILGPVGQRIVRDRNVHDLAMLKDCLTFTDGPREIVIGGELPLRSCDYALIVAEYLLSSDPTISFNPYTPYEVRDAARLLAAWNLFGNVIELRNVYTYVDERGNDRSQYYRNHPDWP